MAEKLGDLDFAFLQGTAVLRLVLTVADVVPGERRVHDYEVELPRERLAGCGPGFCPFRIKLLRRGRGTMKLARSLLSSPWPEIPTIGFRRAIGCGPCCMVNRFMRL